LVEGVLLGELGGGVLGCLVLLSWRFGVVDERELGRMAGRKKKGLGRMRREKEL
jgi:hypothetical protein